MRTRALEPCGAGLTAYFGKSRVTRAHLHEPCDMHRDSPVTNAMKYLA